MSFPPAVLTQVHDPRVPLDAQRLDITVRTGTGTGGTALSAFDNALQRAGVADFNLVVLSSVIPPRSRVRVVDGRLDGGHGDVLFCVQARAEADRPGQWAWAGLGWCTDATGGGLFVEHHADTEADVIGLIELSLSEMNQTRGGGYGPVQMAVASAQCIDRPVCALVTAAYRVGTWYAETGPAADVPAQRADTATATGASVVEVESTITPALAHELHELYRTSFAELEEHAAARQLLDADEFLAEVSDPRIDKYVVRDQAGAVVGLTTLTSDLAAVPWISPAFFRTRFPEQADSGALHYLGFTLVRPDQRQQEVFRAMVAEVTARMLPQRGVVAWDMCRLRQTQGLMTGIEEMLTSMADVETVILDEQTYVASLFHGPYGHRTDPIRTKEPVVAAAPRAREPRRAKASATRRS